MLIVLVLSVFGVWTMSRTNKEEYNGIDFTPTENGWFTIINNQQFLFNYLPQDLEDVNSTQIAILGNKVYLTYDPEDKEIEKTYTLNYLSSLFYQNNIRTVLSCTKEKDCPEELPIVNCDEATADIVLIRSGNESKIFKENKCYIIQSQDSEYLTLLRERFVYQFLDVMK